MATNDFLAFATGGNANVESQNAWVTDPTVANGFYGGIAPSAKFNKAWRQAGFPGASISEWVLQTLETVNVPDDGNVQNYVNNFNAALTQLITSLTRTRLSAPLNLYVSTVGSDANNGLTPSTPFATLQHSYDYLMERIDMGGYPVTVNIAPGEYGGLACAGLPVGGVAGVTYLGDINNPDNVLVNVANGIAINVAFGAQITVRGLKVQASGVPVDYAPNGCGMAASAMGRILFDHVDFGTCDTCHVLIIQAFATTMGGSYSISGSANSHLASQLGAGIGIAESIVTINNNPHFPSGFCNVSGASSQQHDNCTFLGSATGYHAVVTGNGVLGLSGANVNSYLPGDTAALVQSGGQII